MRKPIFVGLDTETTGLSHDTNQPIQVGAVLHADHDRIFQSDIGHDKGTFNAHPKALEVNGFTIERILEGPRAASVDAKFRNWLDAIDPGYRKIFVAVGWNVGSFDMPFIRKYLPNSYERFMHRTVDLNSILFTLEAAGYGDSDVLKEYAKEDAGLQLDGKGVKKEWHDALYDSRAALLVWDQLIKYARNGQFTEKPVGAEAEQN